MVNIVVLENLYRWKLIENVESKYVMSYSNTTQKVLGRERNV